ncbi:MAG TPA: DUF3823 domain-containing protein, partial [Flavisolibacter sp.]|nr:DUF3823 domain-containing protein [Flavisolibacter sp.]
IAITTAFLSCKKDNYDPPSSTLTGRIMYKGEAINVEYNQVPFEIYQPGFGKVGPINGTFTQDGVYSVLLFDGNYKFLIRNGQGPFIWKQTAANTPDTVATSVKGNQTKDFEVEPYYMIRNPQFSFTGGKINGSAKMEKIITDARGKNIERVSLYINRTQFVSGVDNIGSMNLSAAAITDPNNVKLEVTIPNIIPTQNYVFARIGLKIQGVEDLIFSPVVKVSL